MDEVSKAFEALLQEIDASVENQRAQLRILYAIVRYLELKHEYTIKLIRGNQQ